MGFFKDRALRNKAMELANSMAETLQSALPYGQAASSVVKLADDGKADPSWTPEFIQAARNLKKTALDIFPEMQQFVRDGVDMAEQTSIPASDLTDRYVELQTIAIAFLKAQKLWSAKQNK